MDEQELDELELLERAATPGRWISWNEEDGGLGGSSFIQTAGGGVGDDRDIYATIRVDGTFHPAAKADQDFIAAARNGVPALIAELRRLREGSREG